MSRPQHIELGETVLSKMRKRFRALTRRSTAASTVDLGHPSEPLSVGTEPRSAIASAPETAAPIVSLPLAAVSADCATTIGLQPHPLQPQQPKQPTTRSEFTSRSLQFTTRAEAAAAALVEAEAELASLLPEERAPSLAINEVGELLRELRRFEEARALFEEALAGRRARLGNTHPSTLVSLNNLGLLLRELGQLSGARSLLEEAVVVRRATQGDRHPETLTSINNLGALLKAEGELDAAQTLYAEALDARREVLGHAHPDTLTSINNLASVYQARGEQQAEVKDLVAAERLLAEGVGVSRRVLGSDHTHSRVFAVNLARVRRAQEALLD